MRDTASDNPAKSKAWLIVLAALCLAILAFGAFVSTNSVSNTAYLVGFYLPLALVLWGILYATCLRRRGILRNILALVAIQTSLVSAGLISATKHERQAEALVESLKEELDRLAALATDSGDPAPGAAKSSVGSRKLSGEYHELELLTRSVFAQILELRNDYLAELSAIGWDDMLSAERLAGDAGLVESKKRIVAARAIVEKYRKKTDEFVLSVRVQAQNMKASAATKREFIQGFERRASGADGSFAQVWNFESHVVDKCEELIDLLGSCEGWEVADGQILFVRDEDVTSYNALLETIFELAAQQEERQRRGFEDAKTKLDSFKQSESK